MSTQKEDINAKVSELSKELQKQMSYSGGTVQVPKDLYEKTLPEEIKPETVKALQKHNTVWFAAAAKAVGNIGLDQMVSDKKLDVVEAEIPLFGRDHLDVRYNRSKEVRSPNSDTTTTQYGVLNVGLTTHAARAGRGVMHTVREELKEKALKKLAD